jgi:hypothetical protein
MPKQKFHLSLIQLQALAKLYVKPQKIGTFHPKTEESLLTERLATIPWQHKDELHILSRGRKAIGAYTRALYGLGLLKAREESKKVAVLDHAARRKHGRKIA